MKIRQMLVNPSKYGIKCPNEVNLTRIVVHNTANDASANNEVSYMINNDNEVSYHIAVDDKEAVQGIPFNRNTWNAGDGHGKGNMEGLSIEICYSKSGGDRFIKAEQNASKLIAQLLKERGWGIDKVTKHQDYTNKYCPHRTLDMGWERFINMIKQEMGEKPQPIPVKNDIVYQIWDDVKNKWLPNVVNDTDYAGIFGHDVCCVYANSNKNDIIYKVHYKGGKWLPEVKNREDYAGIYNKPIDGFMIKGVNAYRVHLRRQNRWLGWVTGYNENDFNNGYAGILGQEIDGIQIK